MLLFCILGRKSHTEPSNQYLLDKSVGSGSHGPTRLCVILRCALSLTQVGTGDSSGSSCYAQCHCVAAVSGCHSCCCFTRLVRFFSISLSLFVFLFLFLYLSLAFFFHSLSLTPFLFSFILSLSSLIYSMSFSMFPFVS